MIETMRIRFSQIFSTLMLVLLLVSNSAWETKTPLLSSLFFVFGVILVGIASLGRLWCSLYIAGYKTEKLVIEGPYSICRNPLYFFSFLGALGVGFASETLLIPSMILVAFAMYYPNVIKSEEVNLNELHGSEFEMYQAKVPCFFPKLSCLMEPQKYLVNPVVFKKHIFSALWFVWFVGILELIEELHELKIIPTIFNIY